MCACTVRDAELMWLRLIPLLNSVCEVCGELNFGRLGAFSEEKMSFWINAVLSGKKRLYPTDKLPALD